LLRFLKAYKLMRRLDTKKALVLFSGGQDSAISLAWALDRYETVETIGFDYGQRHVVELGARRKLRSAIIEGFANWAERLGADAVIDFAAFGRLGDTAMTEETEISIAENGLPTTFVPGRNLAFLIFAGAHAYRQGAGVLVAGMCEADYSGYPDCRADALSAQLQALRLGMDADIALETPLMRITKAQSWSLAEQLGGEPLVDLINENSHTCYLGDRYVRHLWGYGCGKCPACELRAKGWAEYRASRS
jgi:7-cyano-7-deazaguanine synthase